MREGDLSMTVTLIAKIASAVGLNLVAKHLGLNCIKEASFILPIPQMALG